MIVLPDTCALLDIMEGSDKGGKVRELMKRNSCIISTINIYELLVVGERLHSRAVAGDYVRSLSSHCRVVPVDQDIAEAAVPLKRRYNMSMADSLIYATAKRTGAKVVSSCRHFRAAKKERDVILL